MTRKPPRHRHKSAKPTPAQQALHDWLEQRMADRVAAHWAYRVIGVHAGLVRWIHEAEANAVELAVPQRRHLGDDRDLNRSARVTETREPDTAMIALIDRRLLGGGHDPEHLEPLRQRMAHSLGELAGWYGPASEHELEVWEPLAVRLGDLIGDQVAANYLATCVVGHHRVASAAQWSMADLRGEAERQRKNAREQWRRRAVSFVRWLDQQPDKEQWHRSGRVAVQSVEGEGERRIG